MSDDGNFAVKCVCPAAPEWPSVVTKATVHDCRSNSRTSSFRKQTSARSEAHLMRLIRRMRDSCPVRQLQLSTAFELARTRDRTASRNYSAGRDEFRREQKRRRDRALQRRHAERLRRLREAGPASGSCRPPRARDGSARRSGRRSVRRSGRQPALRSVRLPALRSGHRPWLRTWTWSPPSSERRATEAHDRSGRLARRRAERPGRP
jgi:hypothetical protein